MRILALLLIATIIALQFPMWFGKGGWLRVYELQDRLQQERAEIVQLKTRNDALAEEIKNLNNESGKMEAVEERARVELGLVKKDEIYFQIQSK
jgi:cell division protein FtsB